MLASVETVERITGKRRPSAQARQLKRLRIPFRLNALNHPLVLESDIQAWVGDDKDSSGPNWSAIEVGE